jgi:hypothetical protein
MTGKHNSETPGFSTNPGRLTNTTMSQPIRADTADSTASCKILRGSPSVKLTTDTTKVRRWI